MAELTTVFYPSDSDETGYIKATVRMRNVSDMVAMGWKMTQTEIHEEKAAAEKAEKLAARESVEAPADPDAGNGEPGSDEWHRNAIAELEDKDAVVEYAQEHGAEIDKRGSLETVKQKAYEAIVNGNGS